MESSQFSERLAHMSNDELIQILACPTDYQDDFLGLARTEASKRSISGEDINQGIAKRIEATKEINTEKFTILQAFAIFLFCSLLLYSIVGLFALLMISSGLKSKGYLKKSKQLWQLTIIGSISVPFIFMLLYFVFKVLLA